MQRPAPEIEQITDVEFFALLSRRFSGLDGGQIIDSRGSESGFDYWDTTFQVLGNRLLVARQMKEAPGVFPAHVKYYRVTADA